MVIYNDYLYIGEYEDIEIALEDAIFYLIGISIRLGIK